MGNGLTVQARVEVDRDDWDEFCLWTPCCWFFHTSAWLDYQAARGALDLSYALVDQFGICGIFPLMVTDGQALFDGHPGPGPCGSWKNNKLAVREELYAVLAKYQVSRVAFRSHPFTDCAVPNIDGWSTRSWQTQVVDLHPATLDLWAGVRKSYHALIHHVERSHEIVVDDQGLYIDAFRQLHAHEAGRETRPKATWDLMADWCKAGNGLHVCAMLGQVVVAAVYFEVYKGCAYYGHAASLNRNVTHALVWRGMQELKARGVTLLEMGWTTYPGEEGRAVFKTGFGGEARTIYAVERRW